MKGLLALLVFSAGFAAQATAQSDVPTPILPDALHWQGPPQIPALRAVWVLGAEQKPGPYILRVKLAASGLIPPPRDQRNTTVLSGTIYVGFGETFDANKVVAIPAETLCVAPAEVPHYIWAKDGNAEYQEAGVGPTATVMLKPQPLSGRGTPQPPSICSGSRARNCAQTGLYLQTSTPVCRQHDSRSSALRQARTLATSRK